MPPPREDEIRLRCGGDLWRIKISATVEQIADRRADVVEMATKKVLTPKRE